MGIERKIEENRDNEKIYPQHTEIKVCNSIKAYLSFFAVGVGGTNHLFLAFIKV